MNDIKVIAFDADDTLWVNEPYFQEIEHKFCNLISEYIPNDTTAQKLYQTEISNLDLYGYGIKGFILCMVETLTQLSDEFYDPNIYKKIIGFGKELIQKPVELIDGVEEVLIELKKNYMLVLATKGDLLDQERKLLNSGLKDYFHYIEIMSNKKKANYELLLKKLKCNPENFLMIGNSLKSDILPVLDLGAKAIYVPYHTTWAHEELTSENNYESLIIELNKISDLPILLE